MDYVKIVLSVHGTYDCKQTSSGKMQDLGHFFTDDVGCSGDNEFRDWAMNPQGYSCVSGNYSELEKEDNHIFVSFQYHDEPDPAKLKMTIDQFVQLCDEWRAKVVPHRPKVVVIKHENGQFTIETFDEDDGMGYTKITKNSSGIYTWAGSTSIEMGRLGCFFTDDVGYSGNNPFRDWALDPHGPHSITGNLGKLEKEANLLFLLCSVELYPGGFFPVKIKMTIEQFVQLCDEWQAKVINLKPNTVIIKHENEQFTIETSDEIANDSTNDASHDAINENIKQTPPSPLETNMRDIELDYERILLFDLTFTENKMPIIKGCHYDNMNFVEHGSPLVWVNKKTYAGGFYEAELWYDSTYIKQATCFPAHWTPEQVIECILNAYDQWKKSGTRPKYLPNGSYIVKGFSPQDIEIHMYITADNIMKTAYPVFQKRNKKWKLFRWLW